MDFTIDHIDGIFIVSTSGDAEISKFKELFLSYLHHEKWKPGTPCLHDHSKLNSASVSTDDIRDIAGSLKNLGELLGVGKTALVVDRDLEFGLARMFQVFYEGNPDRTVKLFKSREEALTWLK